MSEGQPAPLTVSRPKLTAEVADNTLPAFVPLALSSTAREEFIRIELHRGDISMTVTWPLSAAADCAHWDARVAAMIRVDAMWLAVQPLDMRGGFDTVLARVVQVFGVAQPHHA